MKLLPIFLLLLFFAGFSFTQSITSGESAAFPGSSMRDSLTQKIFDVHIHGTADRGLQLKYLSEAGIYKAALSTSWELQEQYRKGSAMEILYGLMLPCPGGKVPYSQQACYRNGKAWPETGWVEALIREGKIDFMGELLNQYYGITTSDSVMDPYYRLAHKYNLPVGIHTGGAGPGHGCPDFSMELGSPLLLEPALKKFPGLRVWIMHAGDQYYEEAIGIMKNYPSVYADISVISNPEIVNAERFARIMSEFINAGLEDRLMFGSDNGDIKKIVAAVESLEFLSGSQKDKIYYMNAEKFFQKKN